MGKRVVERGEVRIEVLPCERKRREKGLEIIEGFLQILFLGIDQVQCCGDRVQCIHCRGFDNFRGKFDR